MTDDDKTAIFTLAGAVLYLAVGLLHGAYHYQRFECDRPADRQFLCETDLGAATVLRLFAWPATVGWDAAIAITKPEGGEA